MFELSTIDQLRPGDWFKPVLNWGYGTDDVFEIHEVGRLLNTGGVLRGGVALTYGRADGGAMISQVCFDDTVEDIYSVHYTGTVYSGCYRLDFRLYSEDELALVADRLRELVDVSS